MAKVKDQSCRFIWSTDLPRIREEGIKLGLNRVMDELVVKKFTPKVPVKYPIMFEMVHNDKELRVQLFLADMPPGRNMQMSVVDISFDLAKEIIHTVEIVNGELVYPEAV